MKKLLLLMVAIMLAVAAAGCGKEDGADPDENNEEVLGPKDPITLNVLWSGREDSFYDRVGHPHIQERMPHVTFQFYSINDGIENLLTSGVSIDVMNITLVNLQRFKRMGLTFDMTPLLEKQQFDWSRFTPEHIETLKRFGDNGEFIAVPDKANFPYGNYFLAYNRDIFDEFGVDYPADNMTWDEVIALGRQLDREVNGVRYYGLGYGSAPEMARAAGLNYTNERGDADLSSPLWTELIRVNKLIYDTFGQVTGMGARYRNDQVVAMFAGNVRTMIEEAARQKDSAPNWDVATFPHFSGQPSTSVSIVAAYVVASTSRHKDEALQLIDLLSSEEVTQDIVDLYLNEETLTRNVSALSQAQAILVPGEFDNILNTTLNRKIVDMNQNNKDINTVIRELTEEMQLAVDANR